MLTYIATTRKGRTTWHMELEHAGRLFTGYGQNTIAAAADCYERAYLWDRAVRPASRNEAKIEAAAPLWNQK